jgi:hypothetical protein
MAPSGVSASFDEVTPVSAVIKPILIVLDVTPGALPPEGADVTDGADVPDDALVADDPPEVVAVLLPLLDDEHAAISSAPTATAVTATLLWCFMLGPIPP